MDFLDFSRSKTLNNIPSKKITYQIEQIEKSDLSDIDKATKITAINRFAETNIPVEYWSFKIKDYKGDPELLKCYESYVKDISETYFAGTSICFAGGHGVGKTTISTSILKRVCLKGYSGLYTTLSDIVSVLTSAENDEKFLAKKELTMVDFLVIDEFDSRFMPSDNAADLYARSLEGILRTRNQNKIPTLMCTNSPNIVESLNGPLKASIDSLMMGYLKIVPVFGDDLRKKKA